MKSLLTITTFVLASLFMINAQALKVELRGQEAKKVYNSLTGVQEEGAAGHSYRTGKSINCRYTNADMDDKQGKPINRQDARRYACAIELNQDGLATPAQNF